jgi:prevent-host-death family protein
MRTVGLKTLKNKLSEYIRAVAAGETIAVTDRGRVVAEIVPPQAAKGTSSAETWFAEAVRAGLIIPAATAFTEPPPRTPAMSFDELMRDRAADREDR